MSTPVLTFFNNKGGVGKTSLVYHLAWMFAQMGKRVVAVDLDPQANLTSAFLPENELELLWDSERKSATADTIYQCIRPLTEVGDILSPRTKKVTERLHLILVTLDWRASRIFFRRSGPNALGSGTLYRPFRILTSFWQVSQLAAYQHDADLILADVGPNLGAINRSALIGSDHVVIPLAADLFSLQGLRNLGPTLRAWRADWTKRIDNWNVPSFELPAGAMTPAGYIVQQHTERLSRPVKAYDKWAARIPAIYRSSVLGTLGVDLPLEKDEHCLARLKHYRSLVPMAQEARKPIFQLTSADGAIGSHSYAVTEAQGHFLALANKILARIGLASP